MKDPENKGKIIPNPETRDTVAWITKQFLLDQNIRRICRELEENEILSPKAYLDLRQEKQLKAPENKYHWNTHTLRSILSNMEYTGCTVLGKTKKLSYKMDKKKRLPKEEWVIVPNTHEALITEADFELIQKLLDGRKCEPKEGTLDKYANLLYCADCGKRMYIIRNSKKSYQKYYCSSFQSYGKKRCTSHYIGERALDQIVLSVIRYYTEEARLHPEPFRQIALANRGEANESNNKNTKNELAKHQQRMQELDVLMEKLFEQYAFGKMQEDRYHKQTERYQTEQTELSKRIADLRNILTKQNDDERQIKDFIDRANRYIDIRELTSEILVAFIERILIHERPPKEAVTETGKRLGNKIEIYLRCGIRINIDPKEKQKN